MFSTGTEPVTFTSGIYFADARHMRRTSYHLPLLLLAMLTMAPGIAVAQIAGEAPTPSPDSVIVFTSPRPLLEVRSGEPAKHAAGVDLLFSGSGWGLGGFYQRAVAEDMTAFVHLGISGRRNTDEFENALLGPIPVVANKVNRLFMFPLTLGVQYRLFSDVLQESFRPFVSGGIGPTLIMSTPYLRDTQYYEFFSSFGHAQVYMRAGGFIGIGSYFGSLQTGSLVGVQIRYYTIPFGGEGLESIRDNPIRNFGGIFLSLSIGSAF
jgi:hypothetical protein